MQNAVIGLRAHMGWAAAVAVTLEDGAPRLVHSSILETALPGDRLSKEPYHVAAGWDELLRVPPHPQPRKAIAEGRAIQERVTAEGIARLVSELKAAKMKVAAGAILVGRVYAGWIDDLDHVLDGHAHIHVAEGLAVRDALRTGLAANKVKHLDVDEKSLYDFGAKSLKLPELKLKERLGALRGDIKGPWRQDQKLAALAAWLALVG